MKFSLKNADFHETIYLMYKRFLDLSSIIKSRSVMLLGPRQTGKSTFIYENYPQAKFYNLLNYDEFIELSKRPDLIRKSLRKEDKLIVIDEVQKLPNLLDEVQSIMLSHRDIRFILSGSSARKLKRGGANLLAGRAILKKMHPLVSPEIGMARIEDRLNSGSLPSIIDSEIFKEDLKSYINTYLKEEILNEGLVRGVENFARFIEVSALTNAEQLNYTEIANDAGLSPKVVKEYYQILEDTLVGYRLAPFQKTLKRKSVSTPKFYYFDVGVVNAILKRGHIEKGSDSYGKALEHLIFTELIAFMDYHPLDDSLYYWRSLSQFEVDFMIGSKIAIEVKSKDRISKRDYKSLLALKEDVPGIRMIVVCNEKNYWKSDEGVEIFPVEEFLLKLWSRQLV